MKIQDFWSGVDRLLAECAIVIDRPKNSRHPRMRDLVYPLDYGYLEGTKAMDGEGIDLYRGTLADNRADAILVSVDLFKRDSEIKLLVGCTEEEKQTAFAFANSQNLMKAILVRRDGDL